MKAEFVQVTLTDKEEVRQDYAVDISDGLGRRSLFVIDSLDFAANTHEDGGAGLSCDLKYTKLEGCEPTQDMLQYVISDMVNSAARAAEDPAAGVVSDAKVEKAIEETMRTAVAQRNSEQVKTITTPADTEEIFGNAIFSRGPING